MITPEKWKQLKEAGAKMMEQAELDMIMGKLMLETAEENLLADADIKKVKKTLGVN